MAYQQQQQPVQLSDGGPAYYIKLMARIEEKIAVICNIGRSDQHNLHTAWAVVSGPGQGCGLFFARHHGEPVYGEMVLILIHIVGSYYTGIHRPPLSAD